MKRHCYTCERPVTNPIVLIRVTTGERLPLHRRCLVQLLNTVDARTKRGVESAILRGARS